MIELAKQFVPATDEVWRLQIGTDPEARHFQKVSEVGHYRRHHSTRQGIYACSASGKLLGSVNTHNVDEVIKMMKAALRDYSALGVAERTLADDADVLPDHRWEESYPANGLNLTMVARDLPASCHPDDPAGAAWNQDRVWFSQAEACRFLPPDDSDWRTGHSYDLETALVARIVRFSVIDTVKGQTDHYSKDEIAGSQIHVRVLEANANTVRLELTGSSRAESSRSLGRKLDHGIETRMFGRAAWNRERRSFDSFELVALGKRWGRTVFNSRKSETNSSPVGFVFHLTPREAPLVAPSFLHAYGADWVVYPGGDTR